MWWSQLRGPRKSGKLNKLRRIKLNSEVIECFLEDISDPWETKNKPKHDPFND